MKTLYLHRIVKCILGLAICLLALSLATGSFASQPPKPAFALHATPLYIGSISLLTVALIDAPAGLQRVDLKITIETNGVVQIVGSERLGAWPMHVTQQTADSTEVRIVDLLDVIRPGAHQVPLLGVKLQALAAGETRATLVVESFQDDNGGEAPVLSYTSLLSSDGQTVVDPPPTPPILSAGDVTLQVGEKAQDLVTLAQAPQGLESADIILSIEDPSVAQITDIAPGVLGGDAFFVVDRSPSSIHLRLFDLLTNKIQPGAQDQILATLTLAGLKPGQTRLLIQVITYIDDQNDNVTPQTSPGQVIVTTSETAPAPPPSAPPPQTPSQRPPQPPPAAPQPAPPGIETTLLLTGSPSMAPQAQGFLNLILIRSSQGLQRFDLIVHLSDPTIIRFESATVPGLNPLFVQVQSASSLIEIRAVDFDDVIQPGANAIVLAQIGVTALRPGSAKFDMEVKTLTDDASHPIQATLEGFALIVALPPVGDALRSPQDLDRDGLYEDVDGDGQLTLADAILFAFNYDTPAVQKFARYYDFNGDGRVDFADAVRLLQMVLEKVNSG